MTAITGNVQDLMKYEPKWAIPVVRSITVTGVAASAIQGDFITLNCDGRRIRYRITLRIPDETNDGSVTLYLTLDRIMDSLQIGDGDEM